MSLTKITNRLVGSSLKTAISGSDIAESSSFSTRTTTLESASGSFSTRTTTVEGRVNQGVKTTDSPTFAGATINGTLTASEIHTTFVSSSVATITGSNVFGDAVGDLHSFTGSVSISGSQTSLVTAGNVDFNGNLDVDGTTNLDNTDIDGTLTVDGGNIVFNEDSADQDFRVESNDNTHMFFVDGGQNRIGIGVGATPAFATLDIAAPGATNADNLDQSVDRATLRVRYRTDESDDGMFFGGLGSSAGYIQGVIDASNDNTSQAGKTIAINPYGGNVGIGTTSPSNNSILHVSASATGGSDSDVVISNTKTTAQFHRGLLVLHPNISNTHSGLVMFGNAESSGNSGHISFVNNASDGSESVRIGIYGKDDLVTVTGAGNVGIGQTSPADKLDVTNGNVRVRVGGAGAIHLQNDGSNHSEILANNNGGTTTVQLKTSGNSFLNGGNFGVGVDPSYKFTVKSGGAGLIAQGIVFLNNGDSNIAGALFEESISGGTCGELRLNASNSTKVYLRANSSSSSAFWFKGGQMQDITANNTGIQYRANWDTGFINRIDNNFDGASAASSYMRVKVASAASSQNTVLTMYGDGSARCEGNFTSAGGVVDGDSGLKTQQAEFKRLSSNSFDNNSVNDLTQVHQRPFIVRVEDTAGGLSTIAFPIGGAGVAYNWSMLDSDSNSWQSNQATITSTGTNGNTYHFTFNSGSGVLRIQRTSGSLSFTVRIYQIAE